MKPIIHSIFYGAIIFFASACSGTEPDPTAEETDAVELFGAGVISTGLYERDMAIDPNREEYVFTLGDYQQNRRCLVAVTGRPGAWGQPKILNISGRHNDIEPFLANDGNRLYFASDRPMNQDETADDYNIWYSDRLGDSWGEPIALDTLINTPQNEFYPSLSQADNLYFTATRADGIGREDIYLSRNFNGTFQAPELLDTAINTGFYEFNAYISPDETILIFSSFGRPDDIGGGDLYYSRKNEQGKWAAARTIPAPINSVRLDYCPFVDWNKGYLYFTSERESVPAGRINSVEELAAFANGSRNGLGDIYRVKLQELGWE